MEFLKINLLILQKNLQPMYEIQPGQCHMYQDGFINHLSLLLRTPITQIWRHMYRDAIINHPSLFALTHPDYAIMVSKSTHWQSMLHQGLEKTTGTYDKCFPLSKEFSNFKENRVQKLLP